MNRGRVEPSQQFFMRRLAQEEAAARQATNPRVRDRHLAMAQHYRDACSESEARPRIDAEI